MSQLARLVMLTAVAGIAAACGDDGTVAPSHVGTYPGDVRSKACASHWFTGDDDVARFACTSGGYRITFLASGQDIVRTVVGATSNVMRVDAIVQTSSPGAAHLIADPGIGCYSGEDHGWLAQLGASSVFDIVADGSSTPLRRGSSTVVHPLSRRNHLVLTCDASGSQTRISLRVNGTLVAHGVLAGKAVRFDRFAIWAAGQRGTTVLLRDIAATTR
jgi:hypothetical protein